MKRFVGAVLSSLLVASTLVAAGADPNGVWTGSVDAGGSAQPVEMHLTSVDGTLSGSIITAPNEVSIQQGTFAGASLTFTTTPAGEPDGPKTNWVGTLVGDTITFSRATEGDNVTQEIVVTRKP